MRTTYTRADVAKHCTESDLWIIVFHNKEYKVLDITSFVESHPGGADSLMYVAGKDATEQITNVHPHVLDYLDKFVIGLVSD